MLAYRLLARGENLLEVVKKAATSRSLFLNFSKICSSFSFWVLIFPHAAINNIFPLQKLESTWSAKGRDEEPEHCFQQRVLWTLRSIIVLVFFLKTLKYIYFLSSLHH